MFRNINSMRSHMAARGLTSNSSRRLTSAMSLHYRNKASGSQDGLKSSGSLSISKYDRFSNTANNSLLTSGSSSSLGDYRVQAAKSMTTLSKACGNFDSAVKKCLSNAGVPDDIRFEFDYDVNSGEASVTKISDEKYLSGVQSALNKAMKSASLDTIANGSKILNGKMTEVYYSAVEKALDKCFGQDISELSVDRRGNIVGMNKKMKQAVTSELTDRKFDAQSKYGFPTKKLASVVKSVISDKSAGKNISHMSYANGSLKTADGDISVGSKCASPSLKNTSILLRAAASGNANSMDLWVEYGDLF